MTEERGIEQRVAELRDRIAKKEFGTHGRLPAVSQLAREWGMSRSTVYIVMQLLQSEGVVLSKGNSFYANFPPLEIEGITENFERFLRAQGHDVTMENLIEPCIEEMPEDIAALFGQTKGVRVVHRERLQGIQGLQLRIARNYYPVELAGEFVEAMRADEHTDVLGSIKAKHGVFIVEAEDVVEGRIPTVEEVKFLDLVRTEPVVEIRRVNRASDGTIVMVNKITHVAPYFKFTYHYKVNHWNQ